MTLFKEGHGKLDTNDTTPETMVGYKWQHNRKGKLSQS